MHAADWDGVLIWKFETTDKLTELDVISRDTTVAAKHW